MSNEWIGLMINASFHHGDKDAVEKELERIFKDDLIEAKLVCDDVMQSSGEYYTFVRCSDYQGHVEDLVGSVAVARVVPSYENPYLFTDKEVGGFAVSVEREDEVADFIYGDVVRVTDHDYLENLYGIVVRPFKRVCRVFFRLYMTSFDESISVTSLELVDNVLEHIRVAPFRNPVKRKSLFRSDLAPRAKEAMRNIVHGDTVHRKTRRAHEQAYSHR